MEILLLASKYNSTPAMVISVYQERADFFLFLKASLHWQGSNDWKVLD